eukprot:bmy_04426T0
MCRRWPSLMPSSRPAPTGGHRAHHPESGGSKSQERGFIF